MTAHHRSAGGVVVHRDSKKVIITNQKGDSWSLPKGHIEGRETPLEAAQREIAEEAGVTELELISELGSYQRHAIAKGGEGENPEIMKNITLFLFKTSQTNLVPTDANHPVATWVTIDEVVDYLTHPKDKAFYAAHVQKIKQVA